MRASLKPLAFVAALAIAAGTAYADDEVRKSYTDAELIEILKNDGYRAVEQVEDRVLSIRIDGYTHYLYIYDDDDLQLYFGLTGYDVNADDMNEWNRTKRLSRAYIDDVNDPVLEADLLANAGYTVKQLSEWISVFDTSAREFHVFVDSKDRSGADLDASNR